MMSKLSNAWKNLERYVAKVLGGTRVHRGGDFGVSACDVEHDFFSIETKYRSMAFKQIYDYMEQASKYDKEKKPLVVIRRKGKKALAVLELEDLGELYEKAKNKAQATD